MNSLFGIKDFHRLVVTPNDLDVAFGGRAFDQYVVDNRAAEVTRSGQKESEEIRREGDRGGEREEEEREREREREGQVAKGNPS